ncbi:hypothetical protein Ancab_022851 [Ancistrocladus abbreviatus]
MGRNLIFISSDDPGELRRLVAHDAFLHLVERLREWSLKEVGMARMWLENQELCGTRMAPDLPMGNLSLAIGPKGAWGISAELKASWRPRMAKANTTWSPANYLRSLGPLPFWFFDMWLKWPIFKRLRDYLRQWWIEMIADPQHDGSDWFEAGMVRIIADGQQTSFWHNAWATQRALKMLFPGLSRLTHNKDGFIKEMGRTVNRK